ncbi:TPA: exopolysaccharide biosynthesis polyprenyl glycosylphosphotransferase [Klebsiella pneumoniae]|uniref:exopolysaccharide biosynthesis polyprenyl glycosylphosphotransferase n=1 Tax=Klebsiella pneumoniae TaxID=573 RepID=UPI002A6E0DF4|nr:exopolysaccharide biosynthesis polyprenyl glycosylphosphotransferase [Klebsiella pneumoniae]HEK7984019.1 exopolysaccharide biosynthesis polyprenyl glycosylphosphotransferase [Klebsiella pneumoniae]
MTQFGKNILVSSALASSDFVSFIISMYIAIGILIGPLDVNIIDIKANEWLLLHSIIGIGCIAWYSMRLRHYFYRKTFWFELKEILRTLVIFSFIEIAIVAFATWSFSHYLWLLTWTITIILVPASRMLTKKILDVFSLWQRDTWIIGNGPNAQEAFKAITSEKNLGFNVVGFIAEKNENHHVSHINDVPVLSADNTWLRNFMIGGYRYVSVIPTLRGMPLDSTDMSFIFSHEVMIFRVQQNLAKISSRFIKRVFDLFGSLLIIIVLSPLLVYICSKVKKDGGPAIYGHERIGKNGKPFKCLKFRSMVTNSNEVLKELLLSNEEAKEEWDATFKLKNDPRITKIGHFLRRTSLDELPQLFNVLKGEMSLVGPRPIITDELARYNEEVEYYLLSKPGMTGLWQVSGRSDVDYETRVYLDAWYVKNWSMWNDIAILFKTIGVVLKKDGAY